MNARVEAGPISVSLTTTVVEPTISVVIKSVVGQSPTSTWTCFSHTTPSINGHSISGINPESVLLGGMATSVMA